MLSKAVWIVRTILDGNVVIQEKKVGRCIRLVIRVNGNYRVHCSDVERILLVAKKLEDVLGSRVQVSINKHITFTTTIC